MSRLASNLKIDTAQLLDYTALAFDKTRIKADVKISEAICDLLLHDNVNNKDAYLIDILKAYESQLDLLSRQKCTYNAFQIAFAVLFKGLPLVLIGMLEVHRDNDFWPTLVIRLPAQDRACA